MSLPCLDVINVCCFLRGILQKLPDKGEKLIETNKKIEERILALEQEQEQHGMLAAEASLEPQIDVDSMEWTKGKEINAKSISIVNTEDIPKKDVEEDKESDRDIVNILGQLSIQAERYSE